MYLSGVGDHCQVLEVSEGECTVLHAYLPTIRYYVQHFHVGSLLFVFVHNVWNEQLTMNKTNNILVRYQVLGRVCLT